MTRGLSLLRGGGASAAILIALIPWGLLTWHFSFVGDDAYISFRYSRHFAEGLGLVYNLGVDPPVEGYSEFLWVVLLGLLAKAGFSLELWSRLISAACGAGLISVLLSWLNRSATVGQPALLGAAVTLGTLTPLAVWSTGGMGTMPFVLAIVWLFERLLSGDRAIHTVQAASAATLVVLVRADGALWVALICGFGLAHGLLRHDIRLARASAWAASIAAMAFFAQVGFRLYYYEDWLPNTARAKVGPSLFVLERGVRYVLHFLLTFPGLLLAASLPLFLAGRRRLDRTSAASLLIICGTGFYSIWVGGDFMCFGRFLLPALPFVVVLFAKGLDSLVAEGRTSLAVSLITIVGFFNLSPAFDLHPIPEGARRAFHFRFNSTLASGEVLFRSERQQWADMKTRAKHWRLLGLALRAHTKPGDSLVFPAAGAVAWPNELHLYDLFGLVTREVTELPTPPGRRSPGHDKVVSREFFLKDGPTYMNAALWPVDKPLPEFFDPAGDRAVPLDPRNGFPEDTLLLLFRPSKELALNG